MGRTRKQLEITPVGWFVDLGCSLTEMLKPSADLFGEMLIQHFPKPLPPKLFVNFVFVITTLESDQTVHRYSDQFEVGYIFLH